MAKKKASAPDNAESGALHIRAMMIELFDRRDGNGADWRLMADSVFKAGFGLVDEKLDPTDRQAFYRRIHTGAYERISAEDGNRSENLPPVRPRPSAIGPFRISTPHRSH